MEEKKKILCEQKNPDKRTHVDTQHTVQVLTAKPLPDGPNFLLSTKIATFFSLCISKFSSKSSKGFLS